MPNLASAYSTPATAIVTTAETVAVNVPATPLALPMGSPQNVVVRGTLNITTGASVTALQAKLRVGQNNTTTAQVGQTEQMPAIASALQEIPFHFEDLTPADLTASGYTITVIQVAATTNGTVTSAEYEVASTP